MKIEIRSATEAHIEGYVNAVERDSRLLPKAMCSAAKGPFYERVRANAFAKALDKAKKVELRSNHSKVIGDTDTNLTLKEDAIGLYASATVTDPDIIDKARRGELRGWSFAFSCDRDEWEDVSDSIQRRTLDEIELAEVSILDKTPAYIGTSIEMRGENCAVAETRITEDSPELRVLDEPPADPPKNPLFAAKKELEVLKMKGKIYV